MKQKLIKGILRNTPLFKGLPPNDIDEIMSQCSAKEYKKGDHLFHLHDKAQYFYIVLTGWIKLYKLSKSGDEMVVHIFGPAESLAEAAVFKDAMQYPVNAQAITNSYVLEVSKEYFTKKIKKNTDFALNILSSISARQHHLIQQLEQVTIRNAPQRIGSFLLKFAHPFDSDKNVSIVELPYHKVVVATRLNIKPETFSRALKTLLAHGVVFKTIFIFMTVKNLPNFVNMKIKLILL